MFELLNQVIETGCEPVGFLFHLLTNLIATETNEGILQVEHENRACANLCKAYRWGTGFKVSHTITYHGDITVLVAVFQVRYDLSLAILLAGGFRLIEASIGACSGEQVGQWANSHYHHHFNSTIIKEFDSISVDVLIRNAKLFRYWLDDRVKASRYEVNIDTTGMKHGH